MKTIEAALMLEADLSDELERLGWSPQNLILLLANTVRHMKVPVFLLTSLKRFSVTGNPYYYFYLLSVFLFILVFYIEELFKARKLNTCNDAINLE